MDPQSPSEWLTLVRQHEAAAKAVSEDRLAAGQAYFHVGIATECAIKAYIMWKEGLNRWPDKADRDELYVHDIRKLAAVAGLSPLAKDPIAPSWSVVMQFDRNQAYDPRPMPRKVARSMVQAAFGEKGVVTWIRKTLA